MENQLLNTYSMDSSSRTLACANAAPATGTMGIRRATVATPWRHTAQHTPTATPEPAACRDQSASLRRAVLTWDAPRCVDNPSASVAPSASAPPPAFVTSLRPFSMAIISAWATPHCLSTHPCRARPRCRARSCPPRGQAPAARRDPRATPRRRPCPTPRCSCS